MQYRLRTLLIVLAVMPPLLALAYSAYLEMKAQEERRRVQKFPMVRSGKIAIERTLVDLTDNTKVPSLHLGGIGKVPIRQVDDDSSSPTTAPLPPE